MSDLLNAAPAGFLSIRDDGVVVAVNDTLLGMLDYDRSDVAGSHVENLFGVSARIFYQTHLFPLVRLHGHAEEIYIELRSREGERVPVLLNARRADLAGEPATHCVVMRVRERKKYEDELLRARKAAEEARARALEATEAKSHYLRSVSHEVRTPINALLGYADLLELNAGRPMGDEQLGYVERVRQAARHLLDLVNHVLDLAKIESGAMTVKSEPSELMAAADAAVGLVRPQARERKVRLERAEAPDGDGYIGDHGKVVQVLVNLLSNAVKFTDAGGRIELSWRRTESASDRARIEGTGPWLRVTVSDTGIGIPPDRLEDVFKPFQQLENSDGGERPGGTGLGLPISRELARLMGGDLTAESEPGAGSRFTLWLRAEG